MFIQYILYTTYLLYYDLFELTKFFIPDAKKVIYNYIYI